MKVGLNWPTQWFGRKKQFNDLTALHPLWDKVPTWERHVIRTQAERIRALEEQRVQIVKGYERKIARLERQLAQPKET